MGGGGKSGQVVGYKYYLGVDFAWCHAPVDFMHDMYVDNKSLGVTIGDTDGGYSYIDEPELFGEAEGGVQGRVTLLDGNDSQTALPYLLNTIGSNVPAYRGVTRTVLNSASNQDDGGRSFYVGNNPYLKKWSASFQRILKRVVDGVVVDQWQKDIAAIEPLSGSIPVTAGVDAGNKSILITVDLSSASNGFTGNNATISGGQDLETVKKRVVNVLEKIKSNASWARRPINVLTNEPKTDGELTTAESDTLDLNGLDIGVAFVRYTDGGNLNSLTTFTNFPNPNYSSTGTLPGTTEQEGLYADEFDPIDAPSYTDNQKLNNSYDTKYNLVGRGHLMYESASGKDIDNLIAFVKLMEVVPDNEYQPNTTQSIRTVVTESFAEISTDRERRHLLFSNLEGGTETATLSGQESPNFWSELNSTSSFGTAAVFFAEKPDSLYKEALLSNLTFNPEKDFTLTGGWIKTAERSSVYQGNGTFQTELEDIASGLPLGTTDAYALLDIPSGDPATTPFQLPDEDSTVWYWGPLITAGIYAGRYDPYILYQREEPGPTTLIYDGCKDLFSDLQVDTSVTTNVSGYLGEEDAVVQAALKAIDCPVSTGCKDMNPAHIIRECLTDQQWGLGLAESEVDETSFAAAAQTLYDESFGLSLAWSRTEPIEDFINLILNHIDAVLYVNRTEGTWTLKLIRDDYNKASLTEYTDADVIDWSNIGIKGPAELSNSLTVNYKSRELRGDASLTVNNPAQVQQLGQVVSTTVTYPGIWDRKLAVRVAQRDLITLSSALISGDITLNREASSLNPGDVFKLTSSRYGLNELICRVAEVDVGDGRNNQVRVKFTQDKFALDTDTSFEATSVPDTEFVDFITATEPTTKDVVQEEPYYFFVRRFGDADASDRITNNENLGYISYVAAPPTSSSTYASVVVDDNSDGVFEGAGICSYAPYGVLSEELREQADSTTLTLSSLQNPEDMDVNGLIQINDEIMKVESIDSSTQITVGRGCLDTVPQYHPSGSYAIYLGDLIDGTLKEYTDSDVAYIKLLTNSGSGTLKESIAPTRNITFDSRAYRPYTVGKLQLDGAYSGVWDTSSGATTEATWVHRDRTLQTGDNPTTFVDASIGPETNSDYTISAVAYEFATGDEITSIGDLFSVDKNQNLSHTISSDAYTPTSEGTGPWSAVGVRVKNTRGTSPSYDNWQTAEVISFYPVTPEETEEIDGFWVDANDLSSLFQDSTGNTPVVYDGDPVGRMNNQRAF